MPKYVIKDPNDRIILVNADYYNISPDGTSYDLYNKSTEGPHTLIGSFSRHFYSIVDDAAELADFHLDTDDVCAACRAEEENEDFFSKVWSIIDMWHEPPTEETIQ